MAEQPTPEQPEQFDTDEPRGLSEFRSENGQGAAIHNFVGDPYEVWQKVSYATGAGCKPGHELVDQTFPLSYWFIHEVSINNPEKGPQRCVRTVLLDPSGNAYGFVSNGVYDSLRLMVASIGEGPYDPPIPITIRSRDKASGRRIYTLEPAPRRAPLKEGS